jgi:two-component SAPR family response regulator
MNIVIVDNNLYFLKSMELVLRGRGHSVVSFSNPIEALEILPTIHWQDSTPALFLVDYLMPQMNGVDFYQQALGFDIKKFALISGHFELLQSDEVIQTNCPIEILSKPVDLNRIIDFIETEAA